VENERLARPAGRDARLSTCKLRTDFCEVRNGRQRTSICFNEEARNDARIKVIGVGGGGNNAVNRMIDSGMEHIESLCQHRFAGSADFARRHQDSTRSQADQRTRRWRQSEIGRKAALEDSDKIIEVLEGADMIFVTAGLGGGTGTGAAPIIASLASEMGALTVAVVTKPFAFEGKRRMQQAERGIAELMESVDNHHRDPQ